ncbi:MAG: DUF2330 domain-containing protein [Candidatus Brocadiia bacterium]
MDHPGSQTSLEIKKTSYPLFKTMFYDLGKKALEAGPAYSWLPEITVLGFFGILIMLLASAAVTRSLKGWTTWGAISFSALCALNVVFGEMIFLIPLVIFVAVFFLRWIIPVTASGIAFGLALMVLFYGTLPNLAGPRGMEDGGSSAVEVLSTTTIGDYEVSALKAADAKALDFWLAAGGFQTLGPDGRQMAEDYIRWGWCFVAGKVRKADTRLTAPQPIEISFNADMPVYPMRLTSLSGGPLYLDLIIVAESAYEYSDLQTELSNEFKSAPSSSGMFMLNGPWILTRTQKASLYYSGVSLPRHLRIVHSEAPSLLWSGCVISKISGSLTKQQMDRDIYPDRCAPGKLTVLVTNLAAIQAGVTGGFYFLFFAALITSIGLVFVKTARKTDFVLKGRMHLTIFGLAVLCGFVVWLASPTVIGREKPVYDADTLNALDICERVFDDACSVKGGPAEKLLAMYDPKTRLWPAENDETRALLRQLKESMIPGLRKADARNPLTGEPVTFEESPGDLVVGIVFGSQELSISFSRLSYYRYPDTHREFPREAQE